MKPQIILPQYGVKNGMLIFSEDATPRILLFFFAALLQLVGSAIAGVGFSLNWQGFWLAGFCLWLLWFVLMFVIVAPKTDDILLSRQRTLRRGSTGIFMALLILGITELIVALIVVPAFQRSGAQGDFAKLLEQMRNGFQYNDGTALEQQATENFLHGENPYAHASIVSALLKYNGSFDRVTPLRAGSLANVFPYPTDAQLKQIWDAAIQNPSQPPPEIESHVSYPAGSFLLPAPFIAVGVTDIRIIYFIFVMAGLAYATWQIPSKKKLVFIAFAVISLELWNTLADGESASIMFPFLLIAWVSLRKNWWVSAMAMGLAVTTKQTAWFFLPFYLILIFEKSGAKTLAAAFSLICAIFVLTNAYFIALDPGLWVRSILSPIIDPMFPIGVGIAAFVNAGLVNIRSALPFTILEGIVFISAVIWYLRNRSRWPYAGIVLAVLPLFFSWRSLWSYFFYVQIILLACLLSETEKHTQTRLTHQYEKSLKASEIL